MDYKKIETGVANCYTPTDKERNLMLHALALDRIQESYRRFFTENEGHYTNEELEKLVGHGLLGKYKCQFKDFSGILYHITDEGEKSIK